MLELFPKFSSEMRKLARDRGLSKEMLASLPKPGVHQEESEKDQLHEAIVTMNRLDRQLVAIADTLRTYIVGLKIPKL